MDSSVSIVSPEADRRYYVPKIMVFLDGLLPDDAAVLLDGEPLETTNLQWIAPADGVHTLEIEIGGSVVRDAQFEVLSTTRTMLAPQLFNALPAKYEVPANRGSITPVFYRLENAGDEPITDLTIRSSDQPNLHEAVALRDFVLSETASMTDAETIKFLFDWLTRQLMWGWGMSYEPGSEAVSMPGAVTISGFGMCGEHADNLASLAVLAGFPVDSIRRVSLPQHEVVEFYYDGGWHMFDASTISYYEGPNGVMSCEDIASTGAELILDYRDQFDLTIGGASMDHMVADYSDPANFQYSSFPFRTGRSTGWTLEPGDVLEIYAAGFRLAEDSTAGSYFSADSTAVLTRSIDQPSRDEFIEISVPYNMRSLRFKLNPSDEYGSANIQLVAVGERAAVSNIVNVPIDGAWHDLTEWIPMDTLGLTTTLSLRTLFSSVSARQAGVEVGFPVAPRSLPQIKPEMRELVLEGVGGNLELSMDVFDRVVPVADVALVAPDAEDYSRRLVVRNDGKAFGTLIALIEDANGDTASGHRLSVTSDRLDRIETGTLIRRGYWQTESVLSDWSGPNRWVSPQFFEFYARSRTDDPSDIGPVTFTLWVDGQASATAIIDFVAESSSTDDDSANDDDGVDDDDGGGDDGSGDNDDVSSQGEDRDSESADEAGCGC